MTPEELRARVLIEWRGLPNYNRAMQDTARPVGEMVEKVMAKWGLEDRLRYEEVTKSWMSIVGDFVGRQSSPRRLDGGVLIVNVLQPTLRYELDRVWKKDIL